MTVPNRISIITLGVADLATSTAFYESLGWTKSSASMPTISGRVGVDRVACKKFTRGTP